MKIVRRIGGVDFTFTLTEKEIREAYLEEERDCDIRDVFSEIDQYDAVEFFEEFGVSQGYAIANAEKIAIIKRTKLDKSGEESMEYTRNAIKSFCKENKDGV